MDVSYRKRSLAMAYMLLATFSSLANEACGELNQKISDPDLHNKLIDWVDNNLADTYLLGHSITTLYSVKPGRYSLKEPDFDWNLLGKHDHRSRIVLMGIGHFEINREDFTVDSSLVDSLFFMLKYNMGAMIKTKNSDQFIDASKTQHLEIIADRVAVYCNTQGRESD